MALLPLANPAWQAAQIIFTLLFFILIALYPRYLFFKIITEMEDLAKTIEGFTANTGKLITDLCVAYSCQEEKARQVIDETFEFFIVPPVDLDPVGILKRLEYFMDEAEDRFQEIAAGISPGADDVARANISSLLKGGIGLNNLAKVVRHYLEFVRKNNNIQLAMVFQMNLPLLKKIAEAENLGMKAIGEGHPIGDGIGPLVAANFISGKDFKKPARNMIYSMEKIESRNVIVLKADGPGGNLGKPGEAVEKLAGEFEISKIITVDASLKMEGEKTGKVARGIGAAIGDPGPEKSKIENAAIESKIPLEAYAIKMSMEEAISPLYREIFESVPNVMEKIRDSIRDAPDNGTVILLGVGNTCGVGNNISEIKDIHMEEKPEDEKPLSGLDRFLQNLARKRKLAEKERERLEKKKREQNKGKRESSGPEK